MDIVVENIVTYFMVLVVLILVLYIFEFLIKDKNSRLGTTKSFQFIVRKYNLNMNRMRVRTLSKIIIVVNSFILSVPIFLMLILDINYYMMLLISLVVFVILLLSLYNLLGYILGKKGWRK
ncbi:MAG: hypothetical protein K2G03_06200 [Bacilli bacterium]|nr:hypothetical protein [Bacilli bacterium]